MTTPPAESATTTTQQALVLVVDDDRDIRRFIEVALTDAGFNVSTARNGVEALAAVEVAPPAAIVLDLVMPVTDGPTFLEEITRRLPPPPPVLVISAHNARVAARDPAVNDWLEKPFDLDALVSRVQRLAAP